mgnify:CR=1 FL=1
MTPIEQFRLALEFMLLGMGVVFAFLTILVFIVQWMGLFIQKLESRGPTRGIQAQGTSVSDGPAQSDALVAVISAAVHRYRADHS